MICWEKYLQTSVLVNKGKMTIKTEISLGEFLDKLSILQIKQMRILDPQKLENINKELQVLSSLWNSFNKDVEVDISAELEALRKINEALWEIEDQIREKEAAAQFDQEFIELARSVYITNDERAGIKKKINHLLNSGLIEEKSYKQY
jgi:hypothetical protein